MSSDGTPIVSVCLQTYQHAAFIGQCLESVLNQKTNFPFEIIIGEDDSTDGTREICIAYSKKYPDRIRLFLRDEKDKIFINGEKTGRYNMINNLKAARGKYIALLDGDDYWSSELKLQKQVEFLSEHPDYSICYCGIYKLFNDKLHRHYTIKKNLFPATASDLAKNCFIQPCSCMFRNPGFDTIPKHYWKLPVLDYCLFLEAAERGKIFYINEYMAVYRQHPGGVWVGAGKEKPLVRLWNFLDIMIPLSKDHIRRNLEKQRLKRIRQLIRLYINTKQKEKLFDLITKLNGSHLKNKILPLNIYVPLNNLRYAMKRMLTRKNTG